MKRSMTRVTIGILGLALAAGVGSGCGHAKIPPDMLARIEAAARVRLRTPLPVESLQHPLSVYSELLAQEAR